VRVGVTQCVGGTGLKRWSREKKEHSQESYADFLVQIQQHCEDSRKIWIPIRNNDKTTWCSCFRRLSMLCHEFVFGKTYSFMCKLLTWSSWVFANRSVTFIKKNLRYKSFSVLLYLVSVLPWWFYSLSDCTFWWLFSIGDCSTQWVIVRTWILYSQGDYTYFVCSLGDGTPLVNVLHWLLF
jgi:hypothetical protein